MTVRSRMILVSSMACLLLAPCIEAALDKPIKTKYGMVTGVSGKDPSVTVFRGIPFAAAPVGELRWRPPRPPNRWKGVFKAEKFGCSCIQNIVHEQKPWTYEFMTHNEISEDCLFLNVWTPVRSPSERRPVFFYIHGGAFSGGSAAVPIYDGEGLAKKGLVVVTANYRLGVFGFLAHPELSRESGAGVSGNYGLLDQIAALRWVHENIAAFGGDPGRVTIAGQSAGGMSVLYLIASPLARGLFHRAIVQSGGSSVAGGLTLSTRSLAEAESEGLRFAAAKGAHSLAELRRMDWRTLIDPQPTATSDRGDLLIRFAPIVDGYLIPAPYHQVVAQRKHNDVPVIAGINTGEFDSLIPPQNPPTLESFLKRAQRYGALADEFLRLYPAATDEQAALAQFMSSRDQALVSLYLWARQRAEASKTDAYLYLWDHALPGPEAARFGAFHSSELPYVLNTLYMSPRPFTEVDHKIAEMMSSYWANFAATGNPNGRGLPLWKCFGSGEDKRIMQLGEKNELTPVASSSERFAFFERYLTQILR